MTKDEKEAYNQALDELISASWSEQQAMEYLAIPKPIFNKR